MIWLKVLAAGVLVGTAVSALAQSDGFDAAMKRAMERMDVAMMAKPSGDPDRDFATMMIPHHQGAIDMAELELRYGKDARLRRLAETIIADQRKEIALMQSVLAEMGGAAPAGTMPMPR